MQALRKAIGSVKLTQAAEKVMLVHVPGAWPNLASVCICVQSCMTAWDPWTIACQAPLSVGLSRKEYCSGLPCPIPGNLSDPGIEPISLASPALTGGFFPIVPSWKPQSSEWGSPKYSTQDSQLRVKFYQVNKRKKECKRLSWVQWPLRHW